MLLTRAKNINLLNIICYKITNVYSNTATIIFDYVSHVEY